MNRPHFLFRPNMQNEDHRRAWRLLQEVPEGQKSAFIVRAILQMDQEDRLETMLRRVLQEEKATVAGQTDSSQETGLPDGMLGFLDALILAAADGMVTNANGTDPWGGSYVYHNKSDHGNGLETLYAHCSAICVNSGQQVQQGEVIGFVGSTGNSTGNHLHFETWMNGERKDAMKLI